MAPTATLDNPVFASRHGNLIVTRFQESKPSINDRTAPKWPGLRYEFGNVVGENEEGHAIYDQAFITVDDTLRERDWDYIEQYGYEMEPEKRLTRQQMKEFRNGDLSLEEAYWTTEEFLRNRMGETHDFFESPMVAPPSGPVLEKITELILEHNGDALAAMWEKEQGSWKRPDVLRALERAAEYFEREAEPAEKE